MNRIIWLFISLLLLLCIFISENPLMQVYQLLTMKKNPSITSGDFIVTDKQQITDQPGTYPRSIVYPINGQQVQMVNFDTSYTTYKTIDIAVNISSSWEIVGQVANGTLDADLGNGFLFYLNQDNTLLCAFRYHMKIDSVYTYRLFVYKSLDQGKTWNQLSLIEQNQQVGLWEPCLYFNNFTQKLEVYYAKERTNGTQAIVKRVSSDLGKSWGTDQVVADRGDSRDGMPSVVEHKGTLITIFESWRNPGSPPMKVECIMSQDGGATWNNRQNVYLPKDSTKNAGAPYIAKITDNYLIASFMTDEDSSQQQWPQYASVKIQLGFLVTSTNQILWNDPTSLDNNIYWPSITSLNQTEKLASVQYELSGHPVLRYVTSLY